MNALVVAGPLMVTIECGHTVEQYKWGYLRTRADRQCYECCAKQDMQIMRDTGRITLYLCKRDDKERRALNVMVGADEDMSIYTRDWWISNWPGTLSLPVSHIDKSEGSGFGGRYPITHAYFRFEGKPWVGRQAGHNNQIIRCWEQGRKKVKSCQSK